MGKYSILSYLHKNVEVNILLKHFRILKSNKNLCCTNLKHILTVHITCKASHRQLNLTDNLSLKITNSSIQHIFTDIMNGVYYQTNIIQ